jgi:hypothetical protein
MTDKEAEINEGGNGELEDLREELNASKAEIAYLESQMKKKEDENLQLKAEKEILL